MPDTPELNYAPRPPVHHRRGFRSWIFLVVSICLLISGRWWLPPAWRRTALLYWQHRCLVYQPPNDQVVCETNPPVHVIPAAWARFYSLFSPPGFDSQATLFLHEMQNPAGQRRLVAVDLATWNFGGGAYQVYARVFTPGDLLRPPTESAKDTCLRGEADWGGYKIFAGIADPADHTHFTIHCLGAGGDRLFDGWLQNDDTIVFGMRRLPAAQTSSSNRR
jgi:hypothetical protein